jgi:subtilisin family serine protease
MKRFSVALIASWLGIISAVAQTNTVRIGNFEADSTRILAKYKKPAQIVSSQDFVQETGSRVQRQSQLTPGLVVFDESESKGARVPANNDPAQRRARLLSRMDSLRNSGLFEYVEPDYIVHADVAPTDQAFKDGRLWGLLNYGQNGGKSGADIGATNAWELTTGSTNVIVAVIDTGVRYTHKDLAKQMWHNPKQGTFPGYTNDVYGINAFAGSGDPQDDVGHGTHVAGTIGAAQGDGNPSVGVTWRVQLMACKFLGPNGGRTSDAITCIDYAVSKGARILNNSWGGGAYSQALYDSINTARKKGVLFVAAAGNDGVNNDLYPHYPANYPLDNIISVAALDRNDQLADFSDYGYTTVHVGAPGVEVFSCFNAADDDYQYSDGTSMAAPHVSGVAALILSIYPSAQLSELRQRILLSSVPIAALTAKATTGARVSANQALTISGSGLLHASVDPPSGSTLLTYSNQTLSVNLTDLFGVNNGTVTGTIPGVTNLVFMNDGKAPDIISNDSVYTASFQVPANASELSLILTATAPGKYGATNTAYYNIIPPPPNDLFAASTKIPAAGSLNRANNRFATLEPTEPTHGPDGGTASLWWSWSPATTTSVIIDTTGSAVDNILDVYTNSTLSTLEEVASAISNLGQHQPAHVTFTAQAGQVYHISVSSVDTNELGSVQLRITPGGHLDENPPSIFVSTPVSGSTVGDKIINLTGVALDSAPDATGISEILVSVNGELPSSASGTTNWTTPALLKLGLNTLTATAYDLAGNASPPAVIQVNYLPQDPVNDIFVNAVPLTGTSGVSSISTTNATKEIGEPNHAGLLGGKSVWWTFTAPADGLLDVSTTNSAIDTVLALYTGTNVAQLTPVASNDDAYSYAPGGFSEIPPGRKSGTTYSIAVDSFNGIGGDVTLTWSFRSGAVYQVMVNATPGGLRHSRLGRCTEQFSSGPYRRSGCRISF